jgi:hypothetical protein
MTDPITFLWAIIGILFLAMVVAAAVRMRRDQKLEEEREAVRRVEREQQDQERLTKGTHIRVNGKIVAKCLYCSEPAACKPFIWKRNEGWLDLLRRKAGAPARISIARDKLATEATCSAHDPLVFEEFHLEHANAEVDRAKLESAWETRRARFQREGVHERVREKIEQHRVKIKGGGRKPKSNVVPITKAGVV